MNSRQFQIRFNTIMEEPQYQIRVAQLKALLYEVKRPLREFTLITADDTYNLSRRVLESKLTNALYADNTDGTFIVAYYKSRYSGLNEESYFGFDDSWVSEGYLYEMLKGCVGNSIAKFTSRKDAYEGLSYILEDCDIRRIFVLR